MKTVIEKLKSHTSDQPSEWRKAAISRIENKEWLRHSQLIAMAMLDKMEETGMTQKELAGLMNCSQQYISKVLKGRENLSLETISKIETTLNIQIIAIQ